MIFKSYEDPQLVSIAALKIPKLQLLHPKNHSIFFTEPHRTKGLLIDLIDVPSPTKKSSRIVKYLRETSRGNRHCCSRIPLNHPN